MLSAKNPQNCLAGNQPAVQQNTYTLINLKWAFVHIDFLHPPIVLLLHVGCVHHLHIYMYIYICVSRFIYVIQVGVCVWLAVRLLTDWFCSSVSVVRLSALCVFVN
jgi:hypothetical protein